MSGAMEALFEISAITALVMAVAFALAFTFGACEHKLVIEPCLRKKCDRGSPVFLYRERVCVCQEVPR